MRAYKITSLIVSTILLVTSCINNSKTLSSYGDGPYIWSKEDSSLVIFQKQDGKFDSLVINNKELADITFKCEFDSIQYPSFSFKYRSTIDNDSAVFIMPDKLLALSDIEGNFEKYYNLLIVNNVIDSAYNWTFGNGHLIILGDLVDRGNYVTQCLWLTYHLEKEAEMYGGRVHYLLGNHEQLVLSGYNNYCAPKYIKIMDELNTNISHLYDKQSILGRWIREKNSIIKVGNYLFVHAGISPSTLKLNLSIKNINMEVKRDIDTNEFKTDASMELLTQDGILWYRGLVEDDDDGKYKKASEKDIDNILNHFDCKTIVIGHTPVDSISEDFGKKVIRLDIDHYENSASLYIENDMRYIVYNNGKKEKL